MTTLSTNQIGDTCVVSIWALIWRPCRQHAPTHALHGLRVQPHVAVEEPTASAAGVTVAPPSLINVIKSHSDRDIASGPSALYACDTEHKACLMSGVNLARTTVVYLVDATLAKGVQHLVLDDYALHYVPLEDVPIRLYIH